MDMRIAIWEEENQLAAAQCFIELVICSTCFGHVYTYHQELVTILLVWHVVCMLFDSVEQHPSPRTHLSFRPPATRNYIPHAILAV